MEQELKVKARQALVQLRTGADFQTIQAAQAQLNAYEQVLRLVRQDNKFALLGEL